MIRSTLFILLSGLGAFTALPLAAQALPDDSLDRIVGVVNGDVILKSELDRALTNIEAQYGAGGQLPARDVLSKQVLQRLITMQLQVQRAGETGIRISDAEFQQSLARLAEQNGITVEQMASSLQQQGLSPDEFRRAFRDELLAQRLRQRYTQSQVLVTDTEIENLLASGTLRSGEVRLAHIVVGLADGADEETITAAREKIEAAAREIGSTGDFAAAAIKYSDGPQALEGGDLGWRSYDEVPELFSDAVNTLKKGEISRPMRGPSGFHLLKLLDERNSGAAMVHEYNARHILVQANELVTEDEAEKRIREISARLERGEDFVKLARETSDDKTTGTLGGDMDWFTADAFGTILQEQILALKDGEISAPFKTDAGWHVLQRLGERDRDRTEEASRTRARDAIRARKSEEEYASFLRQLRGEAYIENRLEGDLPGAPRKSEAILTDTETTSDADAAQIKSDSGKKNVGEGLLDRVNR